jgi:hypothetical protein
LVEIVAGFAGFIEIGGSESPRGGCVSSVRGEEQRAEAGETQNGGENKKSEDIIFHKSPLESVVDLNSMKLNILGRGAIGRAQLKESWTITFV